MISQTMIAVTGLIAILLSQTTGEYRKYACLFGLAGQPFWIYATFSAGQWGIFILSLFYTYAWYTGLRNFWLLKKKDGEA